MIFDLLTSPQGHQYGGDDSVIMVRASVTRSVKKEYPVHIGFDTFTGTIPGGRCKCKAGCLRFCEHVAAVLFQVMDSQRQGLKFTPVTATKTI